MLNRRFAPILVLTAIVHGTGVQGSGLAECVTSLAEIFLAEAPLVNDADTAMMRTYTLCSNTKFQPGQVDLQSGEISSGDMPLVCRRNCHIKCGDNGSSGNNCVIDGTIGTYGIFMIPYLVFPDSPEQADNIFVEGVTVSGFTTSGQIPTLAAAPKGSITFRDCLWNNNNADPLFVIDEFLLGSAPGRRQLMHHGLTKSGFKYPAEENKLGRRLTDVSKEEQTGVAVRNTRRRLSTSAFSVTFDKCHFENNNPVADPKTQGGRSIVRIRAADPMNAFDQIGSMDATFTQCTFQDNKFNVEDRSDFRTLIDFYSEGKLTLQHNCFLDSPVGEFGPVTVQETAQVIDSDNFVNSAQTDLSCDFVALLDVDYAFHNKCGTSATAITCQAHVPVESPFSFNCFPGGAELQVEGQGAVLMKDIKLGDRVLVDGGKFEPVYSFGHYAQNVVAEYLKIATASHSLEISKDHMVFVEGGRIVPASHVKVGDKVKLAEGGHSSVKNVRVIKEQGAYAPFTTSGTVVVNGIKASTFVAFQDSETLQIAGADTGLTFQFFAHTFERPHRMWCQYFSACREEMYTPSGISTWVALPHKAARWFTKQDSSTVVMAMVAVPVLAFFFLLANPVASLVAVATLLVASRLTMKCVPGKV